MRERNESIPLFVFAFLSIVTYNSTTIHAWNRTTIPASTTPNSSNTLPFTLSESASFPLIS